MHTKIFTVRWIQLDSYENNSVEISARFSLAFLWWAFKLVFMADVESAKQMLYNSSYPVKAKK